jgi:hypothetical protein
MTAATTNAVPVAPTSVTPLAADLDAALRRLKLATVRRTAAEVLQVAKTQRWTPEDVLRTLEEAEIAARMPPTPPRWAFVLCHRNRSWNSALLLAPRVSSSEC